MTLAVAGGDEDIRRAVENASLSLGIDPADEGVAAQDYIAAASADYRRILTALYSLGYYGPTISIQVDGREAETLAPFDAPDRVGRVAISVDPGPQFTFGRAEVAPVAPQTEIPDRFRSGEVAEAGAVRAAATAAVDGWREVGHPLAEVGAQEITAIHPQQRLDAVVGIAPGPRLSFGAVTVTGNEDVRAERILAIAGISRGEVYSPGEIADAEQRLRRVPAFSSAAIIEAEAPGPNATLPLEIQVAEALPRRIGFGAEVATDEGLALTGYWLHRNLLGGAESLRIDAAVTEIGGTDGGLDYSLAAEFIRPSTFRRDTDLAFRASITRQDDEFFLSDSLAATLTLKRYVNENFTIEGGPGFLVSRDEFDGVTRDYQLLTFPVDLTYDRRNVELDATEGYYLDLSLTPFFGAGDTGAGARLYADARYFLSFGAEDRVTLAARGQVGSVQGADLLDVPSEYLFFSGGGGTVRGQPFRSLSIEADDNGVTYESGGASFVGAQLETRVQVTTRIEAVAFYDFGAISADSLPDGDSPWHAGTGIGVRYKTPIGPIRLDIGTPANGDDAFGAVQVYIGIGQAF